MAFKDAHRSLNIATPLGKDAIQLVQFHGEEALSRLFHFELALISENAKIVPEDIVGMNVSFSVDCDDGSQRYFNGFVERFAAGDEDVKGVRSYRAVVVPWLWFLTQTTNCRIFQEMTVVEIIEKIFKDLGFTDFETSKVGGTHPKREYCVQYRESDFEFVSRLMEEEGIFYYFKHENAKHTLVMADQSSAYATCKESTIDFPRDASNTRGITAHIQSWEHQYQFRTGAWAHTDYDFKKPKTRLMTTEKTVMKFRNVKNFERYDYPGEYAEKGIGAPLARIRMEELEIEHNLVVGTSGCKSFSPGHSFSIGRHRAKTEEGKSFVVRKIIHDARDASYETGEASGIDYINEFECFPSTATFRPARITPKPVMRGCQTAVVTGPPDEEIYPDEFGRVKVQFHWDREGQYNDKSSCWIRVSQMHAGKGWGYMDLPRIDEEVIVDFLEGDPDQPIIIGRVYNGLNKPPFELPAQKTRRGNSTKTYKGAGYNEMSMDDTPGKEQIRIHGQYDMNSVVEHDETHTIHNNRTKTVDVDETSKIGNNQEITVLNNQTVSVANNQKIQVDNDRIKTVSNNESTQIGSNRSELVGSNESVSIGANRSLNVAASNSEVIGANDSRAVGANQTESVGSNRTSNIGSMSSESVGLIRHLSVGMSDTVSAGISHDLSAGLTVTISAGLTLTLSGPGGSIEIGPSGIVIDGKTVIIKGNPVHINP
jgi:type VI secretion system secreted protein VgrG